MEPGCEAAYPAAKALKNAGDPAKFDDVCRKIRDDGPLCRQGRERQCHRPGPFDQSQRGRIFGYSYLEENQDRIHASRWRAWSRPRIRSRTANIPARGCCTSTSRSATSRAIPGLPDFINLYSTMWSPGGELSKHGLIPASDRTRGAAKYTIDAQAALTLPTCSEHRLGAGHGHEAGAEDSITVNPYALLFLLGGLGLIGWLTARRARGRGSGAGASTGSIRCRPSTAGMCAVDAAASARLPEHLERRQPRARLAGSAALARRGAIADARFRARDGARRSAPTSPPTPISPRSTRSPSSLPRRWRRRGRAMA